MSPQPKILSAKGRPFATSAVALQAIVMDDHLRVLLMNNGRRGGYWQTVSGGLEAQETVLDGTLREVREELGPEIRVRPLGIVHATTFHYDKQVPYMIGLYTLLAYEGGQPIPGDDMVGSELRWWTIDELSQENPPLHLSTHLWMLRRATQLYPLWRDHTDPLQLPI